MSFPNEVRQVVLALTVWMLLTGTGVAAAPDLPPAAGSPRPAVNAPLTLPQALRMAEERNSTLKVARTQEAEAHDAYRQASALPSLVGSVVYTGGTISNVTYNNGVQDVALQWTQNFGPMGSLGQAGRVGFLGYQQAMASTVETLSTLQQNVKDAFYALLADHEQAVVSRESLELANRLYQIARERYEAGAGPRIDLENAQIQQASAEQSVVQAEGTEQAARVALNALLELPADTPTSVQGDLDRLPLLPDLAGLQRLARAARGALVAARKAVEQARAQVRLDRIQRIPALSALAVFDLSPVSTSPGYPSNPYYFGLTLSYPLFDFGAIGWQVKHDQNVVEEKEHTLSGTEVSVEAAVKTAYVNYQAARQNAATFEAKVLRPSERVMKLTEYGFGQGAMGYLQVLTAQQTLRAARIQQVALLLAGRQALDALEAAVGKPLAGAPAAAPAQSARPGRGGPVGFHKVEAALA